DIMTEAEESERRQEEFVSASKMFSEALDVDETLAQLLAAEGFSDLEEIAYVVPEELVGIEGFDEGLVSELQQRAEEALDRKNREADEKRKELGVSDDVAAIEMLTPPMLVKLGEDGIKSLEDFAGLTADELTSKEDGILKTHGLVNEELTDLIMQTRVKVGWLTQEELDAMNAPEEVESDGETEAETEVEAEVEAEAETAVEGEV
ncbi:MAG: hypothetical protein KAI28_05925, partial [Sphingomonadales bacterium]|nr:hypothetical protein [Sphingomonadales bacterium]